ncbi:unnamed protein product [Amoebophrya sp. A120]|nr:unnamed protein product [Amoebophrya sp. A120]|eukprot:GSA120T00019423001.1
MDDPAFDDSVSTGRSGDMESFTTSQNNRTTRGGPPRATNNGRSAAAAARAENNNNTNLVLNNSRNQLHQQSQSSSPGQTTSARNSPHNMSTSRSTKATSATRHILADAAAATATALYAARAEREYGYSSYSNRFDSHYNNLSDDNTSSSSGRVNQSSSNPNPNSNSQSGTATQQNQNHQMNPQAGGAFDSFNYVRRIGSGGGTSSNPLVAHSHSLTHSAALRSSGEFSNTALRASGGLLSNDTSISISELPTRVKNSLPPTRTISGRMIADGEEADGGGTTARQVQLQQGRATSGNVRGSSPRPSKASPSKGIDQSKTTTVTTSNSHSSTDTSNRMQQNSNKSFFTTMLGGGGGIKHRNSQDKLLNNAAATSSTPGANAPVAAGGASRRGSLASLWLPSEVCPSQSDHGTADDQGSSILGDIGTTTAGRHHDKEASTSPQDSAADHLQNPSTPAATTLRKLFFGGGPGGSSSGNTKDHSARTDHTVAAPGATSRTKYSGKNSTSTSGNIKAQSILQQPEEYLVTTPSDAFYSTSVEPASNVLKQMDDEATDLLIEKMKMRTDNQFQARKMADDDLFEVDEERGIRNTKKMSGTGTTASPITARRIQSHVGEHHEDEHQRNYNENYIEGDELYGNLRPTSGVQGVMQGGGRGTTPVVLSTGSRPAYRELDWDSSSGSDHTYYSENAFAQIPNGR